MFVAPVLYFIHAVLTGISVYIAAAMQWISGFGFSAGLVDMALQSRNPLATHWWMLIPQGLVFFVIYYVVFRFAITRFGMMTPGRELAVSGSEADGKDENVSGAAGGEQDMAALAKQYIAAVGGSDNLTGIDACITRLRLNVKDSAIVNDALAKRLGASGVIRLNKTSVQIIVGFVAEKIANAMKTTGHVDAAPAAAQPAPAAAAKPQAAPVSGKPVIAALVAPVSGEVVDLEKVPDEAFASKAVGDGIAIKPTSKTVVSPAAGTIVKIFNTNHAFCLETEKGAEIVVHMGLDTVALNGQGFTRLVDEGTEVTAGQPVLEMDLDYLNANARSMISPVVCSNIDDFSGLVLQAKGNVVAGETALYEIKGK